MDIRNITISKMNTTIQQILILLRDIHMYNISNLMYCIIIIRIFRSICLTTTQPLRLVIKLRPCDQPRTLHAIRTYTRLRFTMSRNILTLYMRSTNCRTDHINFRINIRYTTRCRFTITRNMRQINIQRVFAPIKYTTLCLYP